MNNMRFNRWFPTVVGLLTVGVILVGAYIR